MTGGRGGGSAGWRFVFRAFYRLVRLIDPAIRAWLRLGGPGLGRTVRLTVPGRRTGRPRPVLLTALTVDGRLYLGHPNGPTAWTRNLDAGGGRATLALPGGDRGSRDDRDLGTARPVRAERLHPGRERDRVIRSTWDQQPVLADLLYRAAHRHIDAVGVYYRIEDDPASDADWRP